MVHKKAGALLLFFKLLLLLNHDKLKALC